MRTSWDNTVTSDQGSEEWEDVETTREQSEKNKANKIKPSSHTLDVSY